MYRHLPPSRHVSNKVMSMFISPNWLKIVVIIFFLFHHLCLIIKQNMKLSFSIFVDDNNFIFFFLLNKNIKKFIPLSTQNILFICKSGVIYCYSFAI